jgi:hypothetical protein
LATVVTSYAPLSVQSLSVLGYLPAHRNRADDLRRRSPKTKARILEDASVVEPTAAWDMQKFWYNVTKAGEVKYGNFAQIESQNRER